MQIFNFLGDILFRLIFGPYHRAHIARTLGREGNGEVQPRFRLAGLALAIRGRVNAPEAHAISNGPFRPRQT